MRGAAEDLIYTDDFESSDSVDLRGGASAGVRSGRTGSTAAVTNGHSLTGSGRTRVHQYKRAETRSSGHSEAGE